MTENQRTPRADVVDVTVAVGIPNVRAFASNQERRLAADRPKCPDRRIDSAGNKLLGSLLQTTGFIESAGHRVAIRPFAVRSSVAGASVAVTQNWSLSGVPAHNS